MKIAHNNLYYKFGEFLFEESSLRLFYGEEALKIEPQVAQLLKFLLQNRLQVISQSDLLTLLWADRVVSADALRSSIKKLRDILNDDAKSPKYLKTIPLKGYKFIGEVEVLNKAHKPSGIKRFGSLAGILTISVLAFVLFVLWQSYTTKLFDEPPSITKLTTMAGSELLPSYDPQQERLIFSHRANKDDFLQLYVKDLPSGKVTRLTWDDANYGKPMWSPHTNQFAYIRSTPQAMHHYVSEFDPQQGMVNIRRLNHPILSSHYLLAWSRNQQGLYLTDKTGPAKPQGVWLYNIGSNTVEQISSPSVPGQGDYFVSESSDGSKLAILRSLSLNKHELLVLHLSTGEIVYENQLPFKMHRLVWSADDSSITLGSFDGKLLRVTLSSREIEDITPNAEFVNNLFYQCGEECFFMRQHNGNYLDIAEQANPFSQTRAGSFGHFEVSGANDFPLYANESERLYFFSQYSQTSRIEYVGTNGAINTVLDFEQVKEIQSLAINTTDTHFVGLADSVLFLHEIEKNKTNYLSKQSDIIYPPHWIDEKHFVYARLEKNEAMLYRYSLLDNTSTFLVRGYVALINLDNNSRLLIDKDYKLFRENAQARAQIGTLPSSQANRFKVLGEHLYYTGRKENTNFLYRLHIESGELDETAIAKNRYKANFDVSENGEKLAVVRSLLAQSDIIKLELP